MDEVLDKMESAVISAEPKSTQTEFDHLYKNWGKLGNQEERRQELLENQKYNRNNKVDAFRGILELVNAVEENDIFRQDRQDRVHYRPSIYVAGFNRTSPSYSNVLMMSEWMVEKPLDLHEEWYVTPCPKAVRMLVVANAGKTKFFTKYGQFKFCTQTLLPGGNNFDSNRDKRHCYCVVDCFYLEANRTMYVLDFLAWNNQPMTDCETEFRNFWLESQFAERPEFGVVNKKNKVKMVLLPKIPCTPEKLNEFMMTWPPFGGVEPMVDGLLFYHKKAHYMSGPTPLVGWLYPYMVQEVLGADITVHQAYLLQKPEGYVDQRTFIKKFEEKMTNRSGKRNRNSSSMDTSDVPKSEIKSKEHSAVTDKMDAEETSQKRSDNPEKVEMESSNGLDNPKIEND